MEATMIDKIVPITVSTFWKTVKPFVTCLVTFGTDFFWDLQLVEETARYVYRILAAKQLFNAPTTFGFRLRASDLYPPIPYTEITVTKGIADLARFARSKGINLAILKNMNPWLRETSLSNHSGRTYVIKIPTKEGMTYDPKKTVAHDKRWVIE